MPGASYVTVSRCARSSAADASWQLGATMFLVFGALAVALAAIGLYSVIAYSVAQRSTSWVFARSWAPSSGCRPARGRRRLGHGVTGVASASCSR